MFAGTPEFAVPTLQALLQTEHEIVGVYTQPDRPAGRGRQSQSSPIKQLAEHRRLPIFQPSTLKDAEAAATLQRSRPEAMIVVAYGLLLPPAILAIPRLGCINVHASLLPRWRGAAPIQRAIEAGDETTGVTIMQMERGLDTGPMLARAVTTIGDDDTSASLHDRLAAIGAQLLVATLTALSRGEATPQVQDDGAATYAAKIRKEEGVLDWSLPSALLARKVRAFNPWPSAFTYLCREPLRVWRATVGGVTRAAPGTIVNIAADAIEVATGDGVLRLIEVQAAGGKRQAAASFVNGHALAIGDRLGDCAP